VKTPDNIINGYYYTIPPYVDGWLPFVGHGIKFSKDIIGFVRNAYLKHGKVFKVQIFKSRMAIICDRKLAKEYFTATEKQMSMYDVLLRLYFGQAFSDNPSSFPNMINIVKKTISVRYEEFVPKIKDEALAMIERMKAETEGEKGNEMDLSAEMIKFVARTSAKCFANIDMDEDFYKILCDFTQLLNNIVKLTYFVPAIILKYTIGIKLRKYRKQMTNVLKNEVQKYRKDFTKNDSQIIRYSVDYVDPNNGSRLTDEDVGDIIVSLLYVSSENTALGLAAAITDLAMHPQMWDRVAEESAKHLANNDMKAIFTSNLIDAVVMESARLTSHIFSLNRLPKEKKTLGDYYVGDVDIVAFCEPMLMVHDCANEIYSGDTTKYNPDRFLNGEPKDQYSVMTWGAGIHMCPGKQFAIYEIKTAIALIVTHFEKLEIKNIGPLDYFSPSAFAERHTTFLMKPLDKPLFFENENVMTIDNHNVRLFETEKGNGILFTSYFDHDEQKQMFEMLTTNATLCENDDKPYPISYHNNVYTGESNCVEPTVLYESAKKIWNIVHENKEKIKMNVFDNFCPNSMYAQMYGFNTIMKSHVDEHVDYGISISLGNSCSFTFGDHEIMLNSGDVFIADFSKVMHGVTNIIPDTAPGWFTEVKTFDKARCSIQIRDISNCNNQKITNEEFLQLIGK
jgi:cytochrome P450/alkylated DNA repair dioxygenase AlkB